MKKKVKTLLFGDPNECINAGEILKALDVLSEHSHEYLHVDDIEAFETALVDWNPTLTVILANGAAGMESAYRCRQRRPNLAVFWFSDDREFGMQSYRLECAYFSTKPVTPEKLTNGIQRCHHIGIPYGVSSIN